MDFKQYGFRAGELRDILLFNGNYKSLVVECNKKYRYFVTNYDILQDNFEEFKLFMLSYDRHIGFLEIQTEGKTIPSGFDEICKHINHININIYDQELLANFKLLNIKNFIPDYSVNIFECNNIFDINEFKMKYNIPKEKIFISGLVIDETVIMDNGYNLLVEL